MSIIENPVLRGFRPDPSFCYVDDTYYIATSTFEWFPGVQIHASKDLVNWKVVSRPLNTKEKLDLTGIHSSSGIWAPCLSYSDGKFYLIFTLNKTWKNKASFHDCPNYITTCQTIDGDWSKPTFLNASGFDPTLFHDDDGRKWFLNMEHNHRKKGTHDVFHGVILQEYDEKQNKLIGPIKRIFTKSSDTRSNSSEGPHMLKKDGYYYLWCAEGGTVYEHSQIVARSKTIDGPYECHPITPMMTTRDHRDYPLQKAGHGQAVVNNRGEWFYAHLCSRPLPGTTRCVLGRETAIHKLEWKNDWPYLVNENDNILPALTLEVPGNAVQEIETKMHYTFDSYDFLEDFQTLRLPFNKEIMNIEENKNHLRIYGRETLASEFEQACIARRQTEFKFTAETKIKCNPTSYRHMAGMTYRYDERNQFFFRITFDQYSDNKFFIGMNKLDRGIHDIIEEEIDFKGEITLKIEVEFDKVKFLYSLDDKEFKQFCDVLDASILSDDYVEPLGFTGAFVGLQVIDIQNHDFYADYEYFTYENK